MDLSAMTREAGRAQQSALREDPEAEADKEVLRLGVEKEETESSDDNTTQYSIHPPFEFPYFLLLQGYSHRQVSPLLVYLEFSQVDDDVCSPVRVKRYSTLLQLYLSCQTARTSLIFSEWSRELKHGGAFGPTDPFRLRLSRLCRSTSLLLTGKPGEDERICC